MVHDQSDKWSNGLPAKHQRFVIRATTSKATITSTTRAAITIPMIATIPSPEANEKNEKEIIDNCIILAKSERCLLNKIIKVTISYHSHPAILQFEFDSLVSQKRYQLED